jgi:beta-glucosidase
MVTLHLLLSGVAPLAAVRRFVWGASEAAYQVEGSREADGRQPSVWDAFDTASVHSSTIRAHRPDGTPNVYRNESGAIADLDYERFRESAALASELGFGAARLSVSWPRVMTYQRGSAPSSKPLKWSINAAGIAHYRRVLDAYAARGVDVALTMMHWDTPLLLEEHASEGGSCHNTSFWLCDWSAEAFEEYAALLLRELGDHKCIRWWLTINEPLTIIGNGYAAGGAYPPGRGSDRTQCAAGDDQVEPSVAAKNLLLAHARAFHAWRRAGSPGAACGIVLSGDWRMAFTDSAADRAAATRSLEWQVPLFMDPIRLGTWPASVVAAVGGRMAAATAGRWAWTVAEIALVHGAHDVHFFMNHYTSNWARAAQHSEGCGWACDAAAETSGRNFTSGQPMGTPSSIGWLFNHGAGLGAVVAWYHARYPSSTFLVTENGWGNASTSAEERSLNDFERCNFLRDYVGNLSLAASTHGIAVGGYFVWSLLDDFEWTHGYSTPFGLVHVNRSTQQRTPKLSARWLARHLTPMPQLPTPPLAPCEHHDVEVTWI